MTQLDPHPLALSMIPGIGNMMYKQLVDQYGSAKDIFNLSSRILRKIPRIGEETVQAIASKKTLLKANHVLDKHLKEGCKIVSYDDQCYPTRLKHIPDPPPILYYSNDLNFNCPKVISIIGTREATDYGKKNLERIMVGLQDYDVIVVSGLARGIDIHTHRLALKYGIPTIAVVAGGLNNIYPDEHKTEAYKMSKNGGGIVSEQPLGTLLEKYHFPIRNRIIAGVSDATIIIEAGTKSGALITALYSNNYSRSVFAIPGAIDEAYSSGCNNLIKKHQAHLLTGTDDLAYIMGWPLRKKRHISKILPDHLTRVQKYIIKYLIGKDDPIPLQDLSKEIKISAALLVTIILELVLQNIVEVLPGNKYRLLAS